MAACCAYRTADKPDLGAGAALVWSVFRAHLGDRTRGVVWRRWTGMCQTVEGGGASRAQTPPSTTPTRDQRFLALASSAEVSGHLVGSTAFKAAETGDPRLAGSIPVHLRHTTPCGVVPGTQVGAKHSTRHSAPRSGLVGGQVGERDLVGQPSGHSGHSAGRDNVSVWLTITCAVVSVSIAWQSMTPG